MHVTLDALLYFDNNSAFGTWVVGMFILSSRRYHQFPEFNS
jgi:hypothetical protein